MMRGGEVLVEAHRIEVFDVGPEEAARFGIGKQPRAVQQEVVVAAGEAQAAQVVFVMVAGAVLATEVERQTVERVQPLEVVAQVVVLPGRVFQIAEVVVVEHRLVRARPGIGELFRLLGFLIRLLVFLFLARWVWGVLRRRVGYLAVLTSWRAVLAALWRQIGRRSAPRRRGVGPFLRRPRGLGRGVFVDTGDLAGLAVERVVHLGRRKGALRRRRIRRSAPRREWRGAKQQLPCRPPQRARFDQAFHGARAMHRAQPLHVLSARLSGESMQAVSIRLIRAHP